MTSARYNALLLRMNAEKATPSAGPLFGGKEEKPKRKEAVHVAPADMVPVQALEGGGVVFRMAYKTVSETNRAWGHWRMASIGNKKTKDAFRKLYLEGRDLLPPPPVKVEFVRLGGRALDDDNLHSAFKYGRDELARMIGTNDGKYGGLRCTCRQRSGGPYITEIWVRPDVWTEEEIKRNTARKRAKSRKLSRQSK